MNAPRVASVTRLVVLLALALLSAYVGAQTVPPFGIDKRPVPKGTDLNVLVPVTVGTFKREPLPRDVKVPVEEDLNVTYKSGADSVFFGFSIPGTLLDAHEAIKITRDEAMAGIADAKSVQYVIGKDPSFFKAGDFMSWSRGGYFFYAKATSEDALEGFMRAFPY